MSNMPNQAPDWKSLPDRFGYMANAMASVISVLSRRHVEGVWPQTPQMATDLSEVGNARVENGKLVESDYRLTLVNGWPFTLTPTDSMVVAYLAATAYDQYNDVAGQAKGQVAKLADAAWNQPAHVWKTELGVTSKQPSNKGDTNWLPRINASAESLREAYAANRFYTRFKRIAAYENVLMGLVVTSSSSLRDAIHYFTVLAGADDWLNNEVYNELYNIIAREVVRKQHKLGNTSFEEADVTAILDDINTMVYGFVHLDTPFEPDTEDHRLAIYYTMHLAKYIDDLSALAPGGVNFGDTSKLGQPVGSSGSGEVKMAKDGEGRLPQLLDDLMQDPDILEAITSLQQAAPQDAEGETGVAPGTQQSVIEVQRHRAPTALEQATARELSETLAAFAANHRPGERRYQETGRVTPLDWYVQKLQSPGSMSWRTEQVPDRRPQFSLALALVCDTSGSMGPSFGYGFDPDAPSNVKQLSSAVWSLTEGFRQAHRQGSPSKIWCGCFNSVWEQVSQPAGSVAEWKATGGTMPTECIRAAVKWLDDQHVAHRYLVVWTDDEWGHWDETALQSEHPQHRTMFLPAGMSNHSRFGFDCHSINDIREIVPVLRSAIGNSFRALQNQMR